MPPACHPRPNPRTPRPPGRLLSWTVGAAALLAAALTGCTRNESAAAKPVRNETVPVVVAVAAKKPLPIELSTIGFVEPLESVTIKSRVSGQIVEAAFEEGDEVEPGQLLFKIDPQPFAIALRQAQAALARDEAALRRAERERKRYESLGASKSVAEQQVDDARAETETLAAIVQADQAAIAAAKLNLSYCTITAPLAGRTGELLVDPGNVIKADDTDLVTITQMAPIGVDFTLPEQTLPQVREFQQKATTAGRPLQVQVLLPERAAPLVGDLAFIDTTVDRATGTIHLRATFANTDRALWPKQYVDVVLRLKTLEDAVVVPNEAVQAGQNGEFVFVIGEDGKAEQQPIVRGVQVRGETVVTDGLTGGERVVTDGQMRLAPGVKVETKTAETGKKE